ncbi:redoxin domain-containing protein [Gracilibacillus alcaliphilus]|uniref:redoxin domain-containing protein n=1 Tax=Gracilibacillus alcaliphilus TaxID=1401441 RepID=UPI00195A20D5|nr:peroxiredoxin [Gracilibacillus alcaliphilus]
MWKNILSIGLLVSLVVLVILVNATDIFTDEKEPNIIDVTGDTSAKGVTITAPNVSQLQEGDKAPAFSLDNLSGDTVEVFDQEQEYLLVNFWATWCPPCVEEMPDLQTLQDNHEEEIKVIGINTENSLQKAKTFVEEAQLDFTILLDEDNQVYDAFKVINMPTSFIIRIEDQTIMKRINGALSYEQMEEQLLEVKEDSL